MEQRGLSEKDAATYIGMSAAFLSQTRVNNAQKNRNKGPAYVKLGKSVRYLKEDLDLWLEKNRKNKHY